MIIAIEGIDGVGKGTQSGLLFDTLKQYGYSATLKTFPNYDSFFGRMIAEYLNGSYGSLSTVHPKLAALLYACDRAQDLKDLDSYEPCHVTILDRYVPSNLAHQGAKCTGKDRDALVSWIESLEYDVLNLPRPDVVFLLDVDTDIAMQQVLTKSPRSYTALQADIHEQDFQYLDTARSVFLQKANEDPKWIIVPCTHAGAMRKPEEIASELWREVERLLADMSCEHRQCG